MPFITDQQRDFGNDVIEALNLRQIRWRKRRISDASIEGIRAAINQRFNNPIRIEAICKRHKCKNAQDTECVTFESLVVTPSEENGLSIDLFADFGIANVKLKISFFFKPVIRGSLIHRRCPDQCNNDPDPHDSAHNITVEVILRGALTLEGGFVLLGAGGPGARGRARLRRRVREISYSDFNLSIVGAPAFLTGDGSNPAVSAGGIKAGATVEIRKSFTYVVRELRWQPDEVEVLRQPPRAVRKKRRQRRQRQKSSSRRTGATV
jgi:hypothetical protein